MMTLHERIYPGEYYNPVSSPLRVHQGLKRLRQALGRDPPAHLCFWRSGFSGNRSCPGTGGKQENRPPYSK